MSANTGHGKSRRPTMMDVAALAGVSQATVSLVLNGSPGAKLSDATRAAVENAARQLGYRLPRRGGSHSRTRPRAILMLADVIATDPWMVHAYVGAQKKAAENALNLLLVETGDSDESERLAIEQFDPQDILGIIYGTMLTRRVEPSAAVLKYPTVLLNCYDAQGALHSVRPADRLGGLTATQHLIDAGRRRIGFINGQPGMDGSRDRLKGYRQALTSNDIPYDKALVRAGNWEPSSGYEKTRELLALDPRPDAIFCANDLMAYGCYDALREAGLDIPGDVAVVGFDDRELAAVAHPPLTTLAMPEIEMGEIAAACLIDMAADQNSRPIHIKVDCPLIERASVHVRPRQSSPS